MPAHKGKLVIAGVTVSRRWLLAGAAVATTHSYLASAAGSLLAKLTDNGKDRPVDGPPSPGPVTGGTSTGARMGSNLEALSYYSGDHLMIDRMKHADNWAVATAAGYGGSQEWLYDLPGSFQNADGWPIAIPTKDRNGVAQPYDRLRTIVPAYPAVMGKSGRYVIRWSGQVGDVGAAGRIVSRSANRLVIDVDTAPWFQVYLFGPLSAGNPPRVQVCHEDHEALLTAGSIFNPASIARMTMYSSLRMMDLNGTNGTGIRTWADRATTSRYSYAYGAMPLETQIDLVNAVSAAKGQAVDGWFNLPALADDDYVRRFGQLLLARLNVASVARVELSNEAWNGLFPVYRQMLEAGRVAVGAPAPVLSSNQYFGYRAAQIFTILDAMFRGAGQRQRLRNVFGMQTAAYSPGSLNASVNEARLQYVTWPGGPVEGTQYTLPATGARARSDVIDSYAIANYNGGMATLADSRSQAQKDFVFGCFRDGEAGIQRLFRQWEHDPANLKGDELGRPPRAAGLPGGVKTLAGFSEQEDETVPGIISTVKWWRAKADADGVALDGYEGQAIILARRGYADAQHPNGNIWGDQSVAITNWLLTVHRRPEMGAILAKVAAGSAAAGLQLAHNFNHCQPESQTGGEAGNFGALNYETQADTPRYAALKAFQQNPPAVAWTPVRITLQAGDTGAVAVGANQPITLNIAGGIAPFTVKLGNGDTLPPGRSFDGRAESGAYTQAGTYTRRYEVVDSSPTPQTASVTVTTNVGGTEQLYRYVRLRVVESGRLDAGWPDQAIFLGGFDLLRGGAVLPWGQIAVSETGGHYFNYAPENAFDGSASTAWVSNSSNQSIVADAGAGRGWRPDGVRLTKWNNANFDSVAIANMPAEFAVELSTDGQSWITLVNMIDGGGIYGNVNRRGYPAAMGAYLDFAGRYPPGA